MINDPLTTHSVLFHRHTALLLASFFAIRLVSFALRQIPTAQETLVALLLIIAVILFIKNPLYAWYLLLGELFLGGAGHFLELFGISVRTWLLVIFLALFLTKLAIQKQSRFFTRYPFLIIALIAWTLIAAVNGYAQGHELRAVIGDLIPYAFFLLLLPALILKPDETQKKFLLRLAAAFLIGSAIFSLITFILFSGGVEVIQGPYYKWFRDAAFGKITDMGNGFWRIVAPEHLLVPPLMIIIGSWLMRHGMDRAAWYTLLAFGAMILSLNLSRTYFLALLIAFLVLKYKHSWKNWFKVSLVSAALIFALFTATHLIVSRGDLGWDLIGLRFGSIARPGLEESALTRTILLAPIWQLIKINPFIGTGLGAALTFTHPNTQKILTTRHFDWGYLELWAELGLIGVFLFLAILMRIANTLIKKIRQSPEHQDLYVGLLAILAVLAVMNITAPVLFHVLGVVALVGVIAIVQMEQSAS